MRAVPALFALLGAALVGAQEGAPPPAKVEVAIAELREMAPLVEIPGTVISLNDARIATEIEGVLTWLAEVGDAVSVGQVVARIDPRLTNVALKRARAEVGRLEAELNYRRQQLERHQELAKTNNASATLLDESRAQSAMVRHQLDDARAQLERAEGDLERTEIRAPFAGHVTERLASLGEYVAVGEDVLRLVDTDRIEIALPAPIGLTPFIAPGLEVRVRNGIRERRHPVRTVVPVGDALSRMVEVRLSVDEADWLVGTPVQVSLPSEVPRTAVAVPRDALIERGGKASIYKIAADGTAEQIDAQIVATVGLWVGIADGVEPGDKVIVRGGERLGPGQPVEIIPAATER